MADAGRQGWENCAVSTDQPTPRPEDDDATRDGEFVVHGDVSDDGPIEVDREDAVLRRAPKYPRFMIAGAIAGVLVALILTVAFPANAQFSPAQVFGFLLLFFAVIGAAAGAVVAILVDRSMLKRAQKAVVERRSTRPSAD